MIQYRYEQNVDVAFNYATPRASIPFHHLRDFKQESAQREGRAWERGWNLPGFHDEESTPGFELESARFLT
jgi:hypothetical protein